MIQWPHHWVWLLAQHRTILGSSLNGTLAHGLWLLLIVSDPSITFGPTHYTSLHTHSLRDQTGERHSLRCIIVVLSTSAVVTHINSLWQDQSSLLFYFFLINKIVINRNWIKDEPKQYCFAESGTESCSGAAHWSLHQQGMVYPYKSICIIPPKLFQVTLWNLKLNLWRYKPF